MVAEKDAGEKVQGRPILRAVSACVLLAGLVLCAVALFRLVRDNRIEWSSEPLPILVGGVAVLLSQAMAAWAWSCHLLGFSGRRISFRQAFWQTSFMLVGKYVPGMVGGIVARVHANRDRIGSRHVLAATLVEQFGAIAAAAVVGLSCLLVPHSPALAVVLLAVGVWGICLAPNLVPPAVRRLRANGGIFLKLPAVSPSSDVRAVRLGLAFQLLHWAALACLIGSVAVLVAGVSGDAVVRIAGSYALATLLGVLAVFAPGGLGVREATFVWLASPDLGYEASLGVAAALRLAMSGYDLVGFLLAVVAVVCGRSAET